MPKATDPEDDVMRAAGGIRLLREGLKLSQPKAAEHHEPDISAQYWSMTETGKVPGVVKPSTQRKLLAALSKAANLETPLTLNDLQAAMDRVFSEGEAPRAQRLAAALAPPRAERQAVFPTSDGDVVFTYPADLSPEGFRELEAYFQVFVKASTAKN